MDRTHSSVLVKSAHGWGRAAPNSCKLTTPQTHHHESMKCWPRELGDLGSFFNRGPKLTPKSLTFFVIRTRKKRDLRFLETAIEGQAREPL